MKTLPIQHLIMGVLLSFLVAGIPLLLRSPPPSSNLEDRIVNIIYWSAFGVTGLLWMLFEGNKPPQIAVNWIGKLIRGLFIWGIILGLLIWYLPMIFNIRIAEGFDFAIPFIFILSSIMGLILSFILSIYSYFFIKS